MSFDIADFFSVFESMNADDLKEFFTDDIILQDGINKPLMGKEKMSNAPGDFFTLLNGIKFNITRSWEQTN